MRRSVAALVLALSALFAAPRIARADPPALAPAPAPVTHGDATVGWVVVVASVVVGAAITTAALTIDCDPVDTRCGRWSSLGIWGGVGVAAFGSVGGIVLVEKSQRRVAIAGPTVIGTF